MLSIYCGHIFKKEISKIENSQSPPNNKNITCARDFREMQDIFDEIKFAVVHQCAVVNSFTRAFIFCCGKYGFIAELKSLERLGNINFMRLQRNIFEHSISRRKIDFAKQHQFPDILVLFLAEPII